MAQEERFCRRQGKVNTKPRIGYQAREVLAFPTITKRVSIPSTPTPRSVSLAETDVRVWI